MADEAPADGDKPAAEGSGEGEGAAQATKDPALDYRRAFNFPLLRHSDMNEEMRTEVMEMCVTAAEKHANNTENAAKMIKEAMDKRFGMAWHVVVGEGFAFDITHEAKCVLNMFFGGQISMLVWKCF